MPKDKDPFFEQEQVASLTECTGLIPALPRDARQDREYAELYSIHNAKRKKGKVAK